ncbi:UBX domain-containing protein 6 [Bacillus rossius redtenbacheri]|uniref:UBX domain-containing protein 6 n=1 Tax=Bacillus rossius redtenbacheri TaxID=93214 RepID=UPI002FDEE522
MADKIKKFFQKKKADAKFKLAGPGYKLSETTPRPEPETSRSVQAPSRAVPSDEAKQAAAAALARLGGQRRDTAAFNTSLAAIKAQVRKELEAESKNSSVKETAEESPGASRSDKSDGSASSFLAISGVYFKCPMVGPEVLSKEDWNAKIREFLYEQLGEERGLAAALIIHTLNRSKEKVEQCVETLCKYLENIVQHPEEEKYRRIRESNRVFQERVAGVEGARDLLLAAGFREQTLPHRDGEEKFLVFSPDNVEGLDSLQVLCDALRSAEPVTLELDRSLQVLLPSQAVGRTELPPEFFCLSPEELKREMKQRSELVDKSMMMRTKAMREKEEQREMKKYRYALIRVRFPDGILLQGTFSVYDRVESIVEFVRENLVMEDLPFVLTTPTGHRLTAEEDRSQTLLDARLVPASVLAFSLDPSVDDSVRAGLEMYLKPEVMVLAGEL